MMLKAMGIAEGEPVALGTPGSPWLTREGAAPGGVPSSHGFFSGRVSSWGASRSHAAAHAPADQAPSPPSPSPAPGGGPATSWHQV